MRIFVTGAGGFVGAAVARQALEDGHSVTATVRPGSSADRISAVHSNLELAPLDLRDATAVASAVANSRPDVIIHVAWSGVSNRARQEQVQIDDNISASCALVEAAAQAGVSKIVGLGSQGEYGLLSGRIGEDALPVPTSLYGASKLATLYLTRQLAANAGMSFAWLRLFSTYGPGDNPHWLVPSLIEQMLNGSRPKTTLGTQLWDYLYIDDVARGILAVATTQTATGVFNLGSGRAISIRSVVEAIRDVIDPKMELVFGEIPYRDDQIWHMEADITRLTSLTEWSPRIDLMPGLQQTITWHRGQRTHSGGTPSKAPAEHCA
ncbi:NAD-dependent epimerase/dehydratase family protein [Microvirga zambiensis]|uniref:NAD-dependent epimerase/dehydratase family protein n=1 Tax=Microvirga zambiensis TaxID=1402137 RepID=UPI00191EE69C|nr:NAD(P)-dependent oxidoreductase [Microvirga zambiensis]